MPTKNPEKLKAQRQRADEKRKGTRARAWTANVYPDSAPPNWQEILADQLVEALVSPLHDKDVWTEEDQAKNPAHVAGTAKKPHYHVVISFKNPTSDALPREIFGKIGAVIPPMEKFKVRDFKQMARYLCHLDQPEKHKYDVADVKSFGSVDYTALVITEEDEDNMVDEMMEFIDANLITSFHTFVQICREMHPEWRRIVYHKCGWVIKEYIKSLAWEMRKDEDGSDS